MTAVLAVVVLLACIVALTAFATANDPRGEDK